jgi:hypothetical protein
MTRKHWHILEDAQSGYRTTRIRDAAGRAGLETDYSRIGWTTLVGVKCTDDEWSALLVTIEREG